MNEQIKKVFEKISNDDNLSEQLVKINDVNELADFLISLGCKISKEELVQDLVNMCKKALHDEALSDIAGGKMINKNFSKAISASLAAISLINPISAATDPLSPKVDEPLVRTQANNSSGDSQSPKSKSKKDNLKIKKPNEMS